MKKSDKKRIQSCIFLRSSLGEIKACVSVSCHHTLVYGCYKAKTIAKTPKTQRYVVIFPQLMVVSDSISHYVKLP